MRTLIARPSCAAEPFRALGRTHCGSAVFGPREPAVQTNKRLRSKGWVIPEPRPTKEGWANMLYPFGAEPGQSISFLIKIVPNDFFITGPAHPIVLEEHLAILKPHP